MDASRANAVGALLQALPFWGSAVERRAFVDDVLSQLGRAGEVAADAAADAAALAVALACEARSGDGEHGVRVLIDALQDRGFRAALPHELQVRSAGGRAAPTVVPRARWYGDPFPGPRPFRPSEAPIFFGRGLETRSLLRLLFERDQPLVVLAGRSGSGKTSLVQAGLQAALSAGTAPAPRGSEGWPLLLMQPADHGGDPFLALAAALIASGVSDRRDAAALARALRESPDAVQGCLALLRRGRRPQARCLLVVDGLEQIFSAPCAAHRRHFFERLEQLSNDPAMRILVTLRTELMSDCVEQPLLRAALNNGGLLALPTPGRDQLAWMLEGPFESLVLDHSLRPSPPLAARILDEALSQPLPLMHLAAIARDWWHRAVTGGGTAAAGGAARARADAETGSGAGGRAAGPGFFDRCCDALLSSVPEPQRAAMPRVLSRLIAVEIDGPAIARPERLSYWSKDPPAAALVMALARAEPALLQVDDRADPSVRLAHEGLLKAWSRLANWVDCRREALRMRVRLLGDVEAWRSADCGDVSRWPHELLQPARKLLAEADLLAELEQDLSIADFLTPEADRLLSEIARRETADGRREDIGLRLARIGDPRDGLRVRERTPEPRWCDIPGGAVLVDGRREIRVAPFRLAAYPVTQAQFEAFLGAPDGFDNDLWWKGLQHRPFSHAHSAHRGNYPATHLSWHDATAFCRWLSHRLGYEVRLPEEWEWQWAAQSARADFIYPWGRSWLPGRANTDESGVGRTMAVGLYPAGNSLQGVSDLAGNTWEWCGSVFQTIDGGGAHASTRSASRFDGVARVIRGGSWRVNRGFARADFRLDAMPEDRVGSTGFRLACASRDAL